jgi:hypothetical protein
MVSKVVLGEVNDSNVGVKLGDGVNVWARRRLLDAGCSDEIRVGCSDG